MSKPGTAEAVIDQANDWIGFQEGGNNQQPFGEWDGYPNGAWCGQFVSWCLAKAGVDGDWRGRDSQRYTPSAATRWKQLGRWHATPQRGDLVFFAWGDGGDWIDHVGIVTGVSDWASRGVVATIEGNAQPPGGGTQGVFRHHRDRSVIAGFARPKYGDPGPKRQWRRGDRGDIVRQIQRKLGGLDVDGDFGPKTEAKLKAWQRRRWPARNGVAGPRTLRALGIKLPDKK